MAEAEIRTTRLNRRWLLKMGVFLAVFFGLGVWGAYDAFIKYPARGREHVEFALRDYLEAYKAQAPGMQGASVEDPAAELRRLEAQDAATLGSVEKTRLHWLTALSRVESMERLSEKNRAELERRGAGQQAADTQTLLVDPDRTLQNLRAALGTRNAPRPLAAYDILMQYVIMIAGFAGGLWMLVFLLRCSRIRYRYEPERHALTLPDGRTFTPDQINVVDKRKWDKFYVFLRLNDGSPEFKLDLLRFDPLEDWFLEMERLTPGYVPPEEDEDEDEDSGEAGEAGADEEVPAEPAPGRSPAQP